jgi:hypothetical protein
MPGEIPDPGNHLLQAILDHTPALIFIKDRTSRYHLLSGDALTNREQQPDRLAAARLDWDWDIPTSQVTWTENITEILGLGQEPFAGTYEAYLNLVHPEDRPT